jgi:hypothetical protein
MNNAEKNFIFLDFFDFARCAFGRAGGVLRRQGDACSIHDEMG